MLLVFYMLQSRNNKKNFSHTFFKCIEMGRGDFVRSGGGIRLKARTTGLECTRLFKQTEGPSEHRIPLKILLTKIKFKTITAEQLFLPRLKQTSTVR
jgi:hypothetical protein